MNTEEMKAEVKPEKNPGKNSAPQCQSRLRCSPCILIWGVVLVAFLLQHWIN